MKNRADCQGEMGANAAKEKFPRSSRRQRISQSMHRWSGAASPETVAPNSYKGKILGGYFSFFLIASRKMFHIDSCLISRVEGNPLKDQMVTNP